MKTFALFLILFSFQTFAADKCSDVAAPGVNVQVVLSDGTGFTLDLLGINIERFWEIDEEIMDAADDIDGVDLIEFDFSSSDDQVYMQHTEPDLPLDELKVQALAFQKYLKSKFGLDSSEVTELKQD